jgi:outer membrane immunogenic protein
LFGSNSTSLPWFGTVRGRIGATSEPTPWGPIFFYITGGLAYGQVDASYTEGIVGGLTNTVSANSTRLGWTFGGGGEARIGTSNWTVKGEVLYIDFGNISAATGATLGPVTTPININGTIGTITTTTTIIGTASTHVTDAIFRVGFNYRFPP